LAGVWLRLGFFRFRAVKGVLVSGQKKKKIEDMPINLPVFERAGPTVVDFLKGVEEEEGEVGEASSGDEVAAGSLWILEHGG